MTRSHRPNIVLIHSDQHRYDCVGAHGHPLLQTVNLDRLCHEGVDFSHAFTPAPICSPARASLLTGQWPTQHGCMSIPGSEIYRPIDDTAAPLLPCLLRDAGYRVAHLGKWHGETATDPSQWGIDDYVPEEAGYDQWRAEQGLPPRERQNGWFGEVDTHITAEQHRLAWGASHAERCIEEYHATGDPFFVRWDPSEPHLPNMIPPELESLYPAQAIDPWPSFNDTLEGKPWIQAQQRRTWEVDTWTWEQWAPMVSRYLSDITLLDRQIGRLLDTLDRLGIAENTLVIYTTDHGDLCGGHGMIDKHFVMYDDVVRVPLIMRWPEVLPRGEVCDDMVCHEIDLTATVCAAAGIDRPAGFVGHDLLPVIEKQTQRRDVVFSQYHGSQFGLYTQRMARGRRWKYVWNATAPDELYDTRDDPGELINRADDPTYVKEQAVLKRELREWMASIGDPMLNTFTSRQFV